MLIPLVVKIKDIIIYLRYVVGTHEAFIRTVDLCRHPGVAAKDRGNAVLQAAHHGRRDFPSPFLCKLHFHSESHPWV